MIGLIVPDLADFFFASCAQTVQDIAHAHGYMTLVAASARDVEMEIKHAQLMAGRKLAGVVMVTSTRGGDIRLQQLQNEGLPIVAFDRPIEGIETDSVVGEDRHGAEEAVRHLVQHGHRNIACVGYDEATYTSIERTAGYVTVIRAAGYRTNIAVDLSTFEDVTKWVAKIRKTKERPTAIFSLNPVTSIRLLRALASAELSIPRDIALVGFGDFELASLVSPPLTTVTQPPVAMAKRAMALLLERITHARAGGRLETAKIVLPATLIVRASCGCTPASKFKEN
jgi:LacI family transcriptional regulator